ncbi:MAG: LytTR family DNA-binding domain-containing protein [Eubacteriales bacterium]|nr:LytTR family DNA-binding domain-containing protein [Eubacteriales bacterium]
MLHIAICDDDEKTLNDLEMRIQHILRKQVVISKHTNPFSLLTYIVDEVRGELDLVILDIKLKEQNGIQIAKTILAHFAQIKIIFMTSYLERVKDIFQISPTYFLLKPIETNYLYDALYKTMEEIDDGRTNVLIVRSGTSGKRIQTFKVRNIYFIESDNRLIHIHESEQVTSAYMKLDEIERDLSVNFCRCHQSYIVNMDKIMKAEKESITLFNDVIIPVSRSKRREVTEKIHRYLGMQ